MYELTREFYHKIGGKPKLYCIKVSSFNSMVDINNFIWKEYENYMIDTYANGFYISSALVDIRCIVRMIK